MSKADRIAWYEWMQKYGMKKGYVSDWAREKMEKVRREAENAGRNGPQSSSSNSNDNWR